MKRIFKNKINYCYQYKYAQKLEKIYDILQSFIYRAALVLYFFLLYFS